MAYFLVQAHSGWRWIVLLLIVVTVARMLIGWLGRQRWTDVDARLLLSSRIAVYIQVVVGVILFILMQRWTDMGFVGEHVVMALLAVGGIEFGAGRAKRVDGDVNKFRFAFIGFVIAVVLVLVAIGGATAWRFV